MNNQASLLVVDDEEVICRSCTRIFERQGFNVETCTSPREGLRLAQGKAFSAILLDIMMPDVSGIEFLEQLRATNPGVPVIIITGYSSVASAAEAMRLHAADYIPKPFTPEEISDAVARVIPFPTRKPAADKAKAREQAWNGTREFHFVDSAWAEPSKDLSSVRVGALLPTEEARTIDSLRCARVGDKVYRGLPMAEAVLQNGRRRSIPSPLTGVVVELNQSMLDHPTAAWDDPCAKGWLARVVPEPSALELQPAERRRVVLCAADAARLATERERLERLGCEVVEAADAARAIETLRTRSGALLLDGDGLGAAGPALVHQVKQALPETRVVVLAGAQTEAHYSAYRAERVLYCAVTPVADAELVDIVDSMFRATAAPAAAAATGALPTGMSAVRIINRNGESVTLLSHGGLLQVSRGVGQRVVQRILDGSYPIRVTLGTGALGPKDITRAADISDRILVLEARDGGRLSGTLVREASGSLAQRAGEAGKKVATLQVQPLATEGDPLGFDERTVDALAAVIVGEMTGTR